MSNQIDEFKGLKDNFLGKIVNIYPGDTKKKSGRVIDINSAGVTFEIIKSESSDYKVGSLRFIAYSLRLTFEISGE